MKHFSKAVLIGIISVLSMGALAASSDVVVENAWVREAPPAAKAMAGYMVVRNQGNSDKQLVNATSAEFESVMLHRTIIDGGMAKMVHQMEISIPAKGEVVFEPNSYHVMLMGPKRRLKAGDKVEITLQFRDGEQLKVVHEVRAIASEQPMGHDMNHSGMHHNH